MNNQYAIDILKSCQEKLNKMSAEEFVQRKMDLGLADKMYDSDVYADESN